METWNSCKTKSRRTGRWHSRRTRRAPSRPGRRSCWPCRGSMPTHSDRSCQQRTAVATWICLRSNSASCTSPCGVVLVTLTAGVAQTKQRGQIDCAVEPMAQKLPGLHAAFWARWDQRTRNQQGRGSASPNPEGKTFRWRKGSATTCWGRRNRPSTAQPLWPSGVLRAIIREAARHLGRWRRAHRAGSALLRSSGA